MNLSKGIIDILINDGFRWILFAIVLVLNFVAFTQDPIRLSQASCFTFPCKWFSYVAGMGTFTMDCLTLIGLWLTIPFTTMFPEYWFVPLIFIGYAIITQITIDSDTYKLEGKNANLNPPPNYLWSRDKRKTIYMIILILDIIIFLQFYLASGAKKLTGNIRVIDYVFLNRFGGYTGNEISFIMAWIGVCGVLLDVIAYNLSSSYYPCKYSQPDSWNF